MRYKAKVKAYVEMIVYINESTTGDQEIDEVDEVTDIDTDNK